VGKFKKEKEKEIMTTSRKMYHYQECGLDNVWLVNGFQVRPTSYGEAISVEDVEGLYNSIARSLVEKAGSLGGKEIRFLRKHLGHSQRVLGAVLGYDEQTVSRWERAISDVPPSADRLLRAYYREVKDGSAKLQELVNRMNTLDDEMAERQLRLKRATETEGHEKEWKLAA
jgi:putative transcriptional regulator